jgi:hypothetical protein
MQNKKNINLLIKSKKITTFSKKLNIILPASAIIMLIFFIISFVVVLTYFNSNITNYNNLKNEVTVYEQKIISKRSAITDYTKTTEVLDSLNTIISSNKNYYPILTKIQALAVDGIVINTAQTNEKGHVEIILSASSSGSLDRLVDLLNQQYKAGKIFDDIQAQGINRNQKGIYSLLVKFQADKSLFQ